LSELTKHLFLLAVIYSRTDIRGHPSAFVALTQTRTDLPDRDFVTVEGTTRTEDSGSVTKEREGDQGRR
jgi:hypothetical protein